MNMVWVMDPGAQRCNVMLTHFPHIYCWSPTGCFINSAEFLWFFFQQLKQQRDKIKQYQKKIFSTLENERQLARKLLHEGRKEWVTRLLYCTLVNLSLSARKAMLLLKKKRFMEQMLEKTDGQLTNLERMVSDAGSFDTCECVLSNMFFPTGPWHWVCPNWNPSCWGPQGWQWVVEEAPWGKYWFWWF